MDEKEIKATNNLSSVNAKATAVTSITTNTHWDKSKSPYLVSGSFKIAVGATLTIASGVVVEMKTTTSTIIIEGSLVANGVTFTSQSDAEGEATKKYWKGITVKSTGSLDLRSSNIRYVSGNGITNNGNLSFANSSITQAKGNGIVLSASKKSVTIQNNTISTEKIGVQITNLKDSDFTFQGNKITGKTRSVSITLTNYIPTVIMQRLDKNTLSGNVELSGTLQINASLSKRTYILNTLEIAQGKTLTVAAGTIFASQTSSNAVTVNGILKGIGTAQSPIIFTQINDPILGGKTAGYWKGIIVNKTGSLNLNYAQVKYTTSTAVSTSGILSFTNSLITNSKLHGIYVNTSVQNAEIKIENNEIKEVTKTGIYFYSVDRSRLTFRNNKLSNTGNPITIKFGKFKPISMIGGLEVNTFTGEIDVSGIIAINFVFPKKDYIVSSKLSIAEKVTLTIHAGTIMKFKTSSDIAVDGTLKCIGSKAQTIILTHEEDPQLDGKGGYYWNGITINTTGTAEMNYTNIRCTALNAIVNMGTLSIINSVVEDGNKTGIKLSCFNKDVRIENSLIAGFNDTGVSVDKFKNGTFIFQNNTMFLVKKQPIKLNLTYYEPFEVIGNFVKNSITGPIKLSGILKKDMTLTNDKYGSIYQLENVIVSLGCTLSIDAGVICKVLSTMSVEGALVITGTLQKKVIFTGLTDTQYGDTTTARWKGITIEETGLAIIYDTIIQNAGDATATDNYPIYCKGSLTMQSSTVKNSDTHGICFETKIHPTLLFNTFSNIKKCMVYNKKSSSITIEAKFNDWGSNEGPYVDGTTPTNGGKVGKGVRYIPFNTLGGAKGPVRIQVSYNHEKISKEEAIASASVQGSIQNATYYIEIECSWDGIVWYNKGNQTVTASTNFSSAYFNIPLYESGTLYTRAILYNKKGGTKLAESEIMKNPIEVWNCICVKDLNNVSTTAYLSYARDLETVTAIVKKSDESIWKTYTYQNDTWVKNSKVYYENPVVNPPKADTVKILKNVPIQEKDLKQITNTNLFEYFSTEDMYISRKADYSKEMLSNFSNNISQYTGMAIDWQPVTFTYNNKKYMVSLWKGQYYVSTGAEVGVYELNKERMKYAPVAFSPETKIELTLKQGSNVLAQHEINDAWLTIYKPGLYYQKGSLSMDVSITFKDIQMSTAFVEALKELKYTPIVIDKTVSFSFKRTKFVQEELAKEPDLVWQILQKGLCEQYNALKNKRNANVMLLAATPNDNNPNAYNAGVDGALKNVEKAETKTEEQLNLEYKINNTERNWIYCNYPEHVDDNMFENDVICFNRVDVEAGSGQIFYSYQPPLDNSGKTLSDYDFAIIVQAKDDNKDTNKKQNLTFERKNYGHAKGSMEQIAKDTWTNFFRGNNAKDFSIPTDGTKVMVAYAPIKSNELYTGNLRYFIDGPATISVYGYRKNWTMLTGNEPVYPYNYDPNNKDEHILNSLKQYSGYGKGYFIITNIIDIDLAELEHGESIYFVTNSRTNNHYTVNGVKGSKENNEIIPIYIAGTNHIASVENYKKENNPLANIANWSAQYYIQIRFINNTNNSNPKIQYILDSNGDTENAKYAVIQYVNKNNEIKVVSQNLNKGSWDFTDEEKEVLCFPEGKKEFPFNYQFILGTNSAENVKHIFRLK